MNDLKEKALRYNREIKEALLTIYEALNEGQRKQVIKNKQVKILFERYGVLNEES